MFFITDGVSRPIISLYLHGYQK